MKIVQVVRRQINKKIKYFSFSDAFKLSNYPDKNLYINVLKEIFKVSQEILLNKYKLKLKSIGYFNIMSYKSDKKLIDFGLTKKLGKIVYHTNFHTNRLRYKISYKYPILDTFYKFIPYRNLNRSLAKILKEDE
jgi:hypothetical protein